MGGQGVNGGGVGIRWKMMRVLGVKGLRWGGRGGRRKGPLWVSCSILEACIEGAVGQQGGKGEGEGGGVGGTLGGGA